MNLTPEFQVSTKSNVSIRLHVLRFPNSKNPVTPMVFFAKVSLVRNYMHELTM